MHRECNHPTCGETCRREKKKPKAYKIKKVSVKMKSKIAMYTKARAHYLMQNPNCKAKLHGCQLLASDVHHMEGRIGDRLTDSSTWIPVCRSCHIFIETHPMLSKELGLSKSRLE